MKKITLILIAVSTGLIGLAGCQKPNSPTTETTAEKLTVTVSILPQEYFVERIAGDKVAVNVMVSPGANHEIYEPKPEQLRSLANSKVYFSIGLLPFEKTWLNRISSANPKLLIVDTSKGLELQQMKYDHHHAGEENHEEGELDPHIWLSPKLVKKQATYNSLPHSLFGSGPISRTSFPPLTMS